MIKKSICLIFLFSLLKTKLLFAAAPVTISGPVPAITNSYAAGTTTSVIYTITNNIPNKRFPIVVSGISNPLSRVTVSNDCGNTLPSGPASCNVGVMIAPTNANKGQTIDQTLSINYQGRTPLTSRIHFSVPTSALNSLLVAGGSALTKLFLTYSSDNGNTWLTPAVPVSGSASFNSSSCFDSGLNASCVVAGYDFSTSVPYLYMTTDNGITWNSKSISGLPANSAFYTVSCSGTGSNAVCIAGGQDITGSQPMIAVSKNGGSTWEIASIPGSFGAATILGSSCVGNGGTAVCVAIAPSGVLYPTALEVSTDGGNTWSVKSVSGISVGDNNYFSAASCNQNVCAISGNVSNGSGIPVIGVSTDSANTWTATPVNDLIGTLANLNAISCTGGGSNAICVAVGSKLLPTPASAIAVSTDSGNTWVEKIPTGTTSSVVLKSVSCTGSGSTAICAAVGRDETTSPTSPVLDVSLDGGNTWQQKTISGISATGALYSVKCMSNDNNVLCNIAGVNLAGTIDSPLIAISSDGGNTWEAKNVGSASRGALYSTSGTSGNS